MFIINPGTEENDSATEENALVVAKTLAGIFREARPNLQLKRDNSNDHGGWFSFKLIDGKTTVDVDIPGDDPEQVMKGEPFESRRLYVDGSSWLWGYALGSIADRLDPEKEAA